VTYSFEDTYRVSVILTSYNQKAFLTEAIQSALDQTLAPFEIIIADDCSTDGSQELIQGYVNRYPGII
jgi:glycosyltransferase involved in cell wall biosynthesis